MNGQSVSRATLSRLPQYLRYLKSLPQESGATISSTIIAKELRLGEVQVRKDLASVSGAGRPKIGYVVQDLIENLEQHLGCDHMTEAVLIGAGNLGRALLDDNSGFETYGVRISAVFDRADGADAKDPAVPLLPMGELESFCRAHSVELGIITVDPACAQEVCDRMVESGIRAIWNFAPCSLQVPDGVLLEQENIALTLAHLNNLLRRQNQESRI